MGTAPSKTPRTHRVFLGLGSNLSSPRTQLKTALTSLKTISCGEVTVSSTYSSPPFGGPPQPDYYNVVCSLDTLLSPEELLSSCLDFEVAQGRTRDIHWGPRTIDIDILLYDSSIIDSPQLTIPHPGMGERDFVLLPLLELSPDLKCPRSGQSFSHQCSLISPFKAQRLS